MSDEDLVASFTTYLSDVRRLSPHTVRAYQTDLQAFVDWCAREGCSVVGVTRRRLRAYVAYMVSSGYADKTVNRRISSLHTFYAWLDRERVVDSDAATTLKGRKLPKSLPVTMADEDVRRIIDVCDASTPEGMRDRALIELLYASGARISEVANLRIGDVDFPQGQMRLFGKGSKERKVPLYDVALEAVRAYVEHARPILAARRKKGEAPQHLFVSTRGNDMTAATLRARFEHLVKLAGLDPHITPHAMRHTYATELLSGGANLKAVQELLGHESLATTQIYTHLSVERLKEVTRRAHPRG